MDKNEECKRTGQLDPGTRNLVALQTVSAKLCDVTKALNQLQLLTGKLSQAIDIVAKRYAVLQVERIDEQLDGNKDE